MGKKVHFSLKIVNWVMQFIIVTEDEGTEKIHNKEEHKIIHQEICNCSATELSHTMTSCLGFMWVDILLDLGWLFSVVYGLFIY